MGHALAALIVAWWILKGIDAGAQQAKTEVRRFREEYRTFRKDVRETVDKGTRAGMSAAGAAQAAWRAMKGAPRGAGAFARKTAAGTGPAGRVFRAARAGGKLGAAAARQARASSRRPGSPSGGTGPGRQRRAGGRFRGPRIGVCSGCGLPALLSALWGRPGGRSLCGQCLADEPPAARTAPAGASPQDGARDADIVPPPAITTGPAAPPPGTARQSPPPAATAPPALRAAGPARPGLPAPAAVPVPAPPPAAVPVPQAAPAPSLPAPPPRAPLQAAGTAVPPRETVPSITTGEPPMTTPGNLPARRQGSAVSPSGESGGESQTHGQWLAACDAQRRRAATLTEQLHAMLANLHSVDGREQVAEITEWAGRARLYAVAVEQMVAAVNPGEQRLIGAISNAGGPSNIPDMPYFGA